MAQFFILFGMREEMACFELCVSLVLMQNEDLDCWIEDSWIVCGTQASNNFSNQADPKRREECARVIENFAWQLQVCRQRGGGHLEHILERP